MIFVTFLLDHPVLREALQTVPEMELERVRTSRTDAGGQLLFWAQDGDFEGFETALENDPTVTLMRSNEVGNRRLYQVSLADQGVTTALFSVLVETGSTVETTMTRRGWHCHVGFSGQSSLERFFDVCRERELEFTVLRLSEVPATPLSPETVTTQMTEKQRTALMTAWKCGYFDVPRGATLTEVATELGVSDTAVSQRLRRAIATLLGDRAR